MRAYANETDAVILHMSYNTAQHSPTRFRALTGMTQEKFDELLPWFKDAHDDYFRYHQLNGKPRSGVRPPVIYKSSPLPSYEDRLYFILYFLKNNVTQELLGDHFGMDQSKCSQWIHCLYGILREALKMAGVTPAGNDKELSAVYGRLDSNSLSFMIHDGTEREVPRPVDPEGQKDKYSGKKKKHTVKNAVITTLMGLILFVSQTVSGKTHDKTMADEMYHFPYSTSVLQDTGYQGYRPTENTYMPIKKPKGRELYDFEKKYNRFISSHRVRVENYIGSAKILHTVRFECRLRKNDFVGSVFHTAAALHNFRLGVKVPL